MNKRFEQGCVCVCVCARVCVRITPPQISTLLSVFCRTCLRWSFQSLSFFGKQKSAVLLEKTHRVQPPRCAVTSTVLFSPLHPWKGQQAVWVPPQTVSAATTTSLKKTFSPSKDENMVQVWYWCNSQLMLKMYKVVTVHH